MKFGQRVALFTTVVLKVKTVSFKTDFENSVIYKKSNQYAANESTADLFYSSIRNYDQEEPFGE